MRCGAKPCMPSSCCGRARLAARPTSWRGAMAGLRGSSGPSRCRSSEMTRCRAPRRARSCIACFAIADDAQLKRSRTMTLTGSDLVAQALRRQGVDTFFYIMGAPMLSVEAASLALGMRGIDVRHEQAAAMAAHAYAPLLNRPGIFMAASGPGTTNLIPGVPHAFADCTPVVALGGPSPAAPSHHGAFQAIDQLAILAPCTKWSARVHHAERIPELVDRAIREAMSGKPGPVYLDLPGDVLFAAVDEARVAWPHPGDPVRRPPPPAPGVH